MVKYPSLLAPDLLDQSKNKLMNAAFMMRHKE